MFKEGREGGGGEVGVEKGDERLMNGIVYDFFRFSVSLISQNVRTAQIFYHFRMLRGSSFSPLPRQKVS